MRYGKEINRFFEGMSAETFEELLLKMAHSDTFSALASGFATAEATEQVIQALQNAGVKPEWTKDEGDLKLILDIMTTRIMHRL